MSKFEELSLREREAVSEYISNQTLYLIIHGYSVDGGYGDAIWQEEVIGATYDKDFAKAYIETYNKPEVYDVPYAELECHSLRIEELQIGLDITKDPWDGDWFEKYIEQYKKSSKKYDLLEQIRDVIKDNGEITLERVNDIWSAIDEEYNNLYWVACDLSHDINFNNCRVESDKIVYKED